MMPALKIVYAFLTNTNILHSFKSSVMLYKDSTVLLDVFTDKERPTTCVTNLSMSLPYYPLEDALSAGVLLSEFKPDLIRMVLKKLVPSNTRYACFILLIYGFVILVKW